MMAVVLVVGISATLITLTIGGDGPEKKLRNEVERFATYSQFASERAVLSGQSMGLVLEPPEWQDNPSEAGWRYRWQRMTPEGWLDDPAIPAIDMPKDVVLDIVIEDLPWSWERAPEIKLPIVAFYPSGDMTLFKIGFRDERNPDYEQHVTINEWGQVVWVEQAEMLAEIAELRDFE